MELQKIVHNRYVIMLAIHRFVESKLFEEIYMHITDNEKKEAKIFIDKFDKKGLIAWSRQKLFDYNLMPILPVVALRELAKELGVPDYRTINRLELISYVTRFREVSRNSLALSGNATVAETVQTNGHSS